MATRRRPKGRKKLLQSSITGQEGINIVEAAVLAMKFSWTPLPAPLDTGIDGTIEIRDLETQEMTHSIIRLQGKATRGPLPRETATSCEYICDERDLDYWLRGNVPVVLVCARTDTREAYWVSVKDYFRDAETRRNRKVIFDKSTDRFDAAAGPALQRLARRTDIGLYFSPLRRRETLVTNLLQVTKLPEKLYHAVSSFGSRAEIREELTSYTPYPMREWVARGKTILSVHPLDSHPWNKVVAEGTVEEFDTAEWAQSDDLQRRRDFVELLNNALAEKLGPLFVRFHASRKIYFFAATKDLKPRSIRYRATKQWTRKEVFGPRQRKDDAATTAYYRHSAFEGNFVRHDGAWFLEIEPTYWFTRDGRQPDLFAEERLAGIKRLEKNAAVLGQLHMWAAVLTEPASLFRDAYPHLAFGALKQLDLPCGIEDEIWVKREESGDDVEALDADNDLLWDWQGLETAE